MTSESSRACIARAVVCLSWLLEYVHRRKTSGEPDESVNPTRQITSLQALAPPHKRPPWCRWPPRAGVSSARFFLGAGAFLTQVHSGTRR